jgi:uncharacterized protein (TIGR03437 family)
MARRLSGIALAFLLACSVAGAVTRRVLFVTATPAPGFRHTDSIDASVEVMQDIAKQSGVLEVVHTEDVSLINAENLRNYDAIYFFTSGELPLSDRQKADLLDFVRQGKGFGGSHSATDTLYTWPDYGDLIGGIFDGHPWVQEASFDVEDPENAIVAHMAPSFRATEEIYQFRSFSRDKVRVLLTLDTRSVNLAASGVNRTDGDFASVWIRKYGNGRVFYSAFGHFVESFRLPVFRTMLTKALLWLTGEIDLDATPRSGPAAPAPAPGTPLDAVAPGSLAIITGERLTSGSYLDAVSLPLPVRLAGTHVEVNGRPAPLFSVKPNLLLAQLPYGLNPGQPATLTVSSVNRASDPVPLKIEAAAPGIAAAVRAGSVVVIYAIGLGTTDPPVAEGSAAPVTPLAKTTAQPIVRIGGQIAAVDFSGLVPGYAGLYQVNAVIPAGSSGALEITVEAGGRVSNRFVLP